ncbi:MAG: RIP metalloprotease, partial [Thermoflexia bacterium]
MELFFWLFLAFVLLLGPMILAHEIGHFLAARRAGVRVLEFGLGFPPRMFTLWREKGTLSVEDVTIHLPGRVSLPPALRPGAMVEVLTRPGPDGSPEVVRVHLVTEPTGAPDEAPLPQTIQTGEGTLWRGRLTSLEPGTVYSLNWLLIGGFVRMLGEEDPSDPRSLAARPKRWRLTVLLAGVLANVLVAFLLFMLTFSTGIPTRNFVLIQEVLPGFPAEAAGLLAGDVVVEVNGVRLEEGTEDLRTVVRASPLRPITMTILRGGRTLTLTATPILSDGHGFLGVSMQPW